MKQILGIIPARGGSKRIPRKNKRNFVDKPLVAWGIESALGAKRLDQIVVTSDDNDILKIAESYPLIYPIKRPSEISGDKSPAIDYIKHALQILEKNDEKKYKIIVILQPTSPLTISEDIDGTIELLEKSNADTAVSVVRLDHAIQPSKLKIMKDSRIYPYIEEENGRMAAHELPEIFIRNCSVYASNRYVIDQDIIIGNDCRGYIMPRERSIDINDEFDFQLAEFLINKKIKNL